MNKALYIGRFQPFHLGHLDAIKQALAQNDFLYIGIGSTQANFRPNNPFTTGERFQMIEAALEEAKIPHSKYNIVAIPNIDNYALWPFHVIQNLPPFQKIYTGSEVVRELFESTNALLKKPYQVVTVKKQLKITSTEVRARMLKAKKWDQLVPKSVAKLLTSWDAPKRLKNIQESEK